MGAQRRQVDLHSALTALASRPCGRRVKAREKALAWIDATGFADRPLYFEASLDPDDQRDAGVREMLAGGRAGAALFVAAVAVHECAQRRDGLPQREAPAFALVFVLEDLGSVLGKLLHREVSGSLKQPSGDYDTAPHKASSALRSRCDTATVRSRPVFVLPRWTALARFHLYSYRARSVVRVPPKRTVQFEATRSFLLGVPGSHDVQPPAFREVAQRGHTAGAVATGVEGVTLHGKVDTAQEASLPWGLQDVLEKKSKTIQG